MKASGPESNILQSVRYLESDEAIRSIEAKTPRNSTWIPPFPGRASGSRNTKCPMAGPETEIGFLERPQRGRAGG